MFVSHCELEKRIEMFVGYDKYFGSLNTKRDPESGEKFVEMINYILEKTHCGGGMD